MEDRTITMLVRLKELRPEKLDDSYTAIQRIKRGMKDDGKRIQGNFLRCRELSHSSATGIRRLYFINSGGLAFTPVRCRC